ncbi:MAG: hypothetical protein D6744_06305 [Planctomycetota bacterium]|nr:MAG: hypothetical protein D6744_06305 [Planctomycetota bacterium]
MATKPSNLSRRIRELRRRHFGRTGKRQFAERLEIPLEEYESYERNTIPPADVLLRMCELTGEDLQWLLTGVASRSTMVIAGARPRHQELIGRIAQSLNERPELAAPLEAFFDLLTSGPRETTGEQALPAPADFASDLIPILDASELPSQLPAPDARGEPSHPLTRPASATLLTPPEPARLVEPGSDVAGAQRSIALVTSADSSRRFVRSAELAGCFPHAFGVTIQDDAMRPMINPGDALIVSVDAPSVVGRPALCRTHSEPHIRCRVWLGCEGRTARLGRLRDHGVDEVAVSEIDWSLEVLYYVTPDA